MSVIRIADVKSAVLGSTAILGLKSLSFQVAQGRKTTSGDNDAFMSAQQKMVGDVTGSVVMEDMAAVLALLAHAQASLVVVGRIDGGSVDQKVTFSNAAFFTLGGDWPARDANQFARNTLGFGCVSADGVTLPVAIGNV